MKKYIIQVAYIVTLSILASCEQKIALKKTTLTEINSLSFTDVVFKSNRDTILVSKFNGEISEIIKNKNTLKKRLIIDLNDEIYSLAYNHLENMIYASTLNNGIVVIDEKKGTVQKALPINNKWTTDVSYDQNQRLLFASGYTEKPLIWKVDDNYKLLNVLKDFEKMQPKTISEDGIIYFDGNGVVGLWDNKKNEATKTFQLRGRISDIDSEGNILAISDKKFVFKNINTDSILFEKKHPNWPIYISSKDTTIKVPVSLPITDALLSKKYIYTSSIDKSIRKWNIENGELVEDLLGHRATISSLSLSNDETQLVSVDLKGGINFWELMKN